MDTLQIKVARYSFFLNQMQFDGFNFRILLFFDEDIEAFEHSNVFSSKFVNSFVIFCISAAMTTRAKLFARCVEFADVIIGSPGTRFVFYACKR